MATATVGGVQYSFAYNEEGMRTAKVADGVRTDYLYDGALLLRETQTDADGNEVYTLYFTYDEAGRPFSLTYNGETFYYVFDIYGNVNYIYNAAGEVILTFLYRDMQGENVTTRRNPQASTASSVVRAVSLLNPFLYKGYYYDTDLDLYYCGSRYYDWNTCRWLNADGYVSTGQGFVGNNMYAYCLNNPVMLIDEDGWLSHPGEIHNAVVKHASNKYEFYKEQRILYKNGGYGRADLISKDGYVWDVKRDKPGHITRGAKQVKNYAANTWARFPSMDLKIGDNRTIEDHFYYTSGTETYLVTYQNVGNGVITYDYSLYRSEQSPVYFPTIEPSFMFVFCASLISITALLSGGSSILAFAFI